MGVRRVRIFKSMFCRARGISKQSSQHISRAEMMLFTHRTCKITTTQSPIKSCSIVSLALNLNTYPYHDNKNTIKKTTLHAGKKYSKPMDLLSRKNTIRQRVNPSYTSIRWLARKHLDLISGWEERCNRRGWFFSTRDIHGQRKTSRNLTLHHESGKSVSLGD